MNIVGIEHVSLNVRDMQKSKDFYTRIMGFKYLEVVDCGDFDIHYFALPGGSRLELFDYHGVQPIDSA
ncbi:MAG: VOC family protein [Anaerolineaceae bacterium]